MFFRQNIVKMKVGAFILNLMFLLALTVNAKAEGAHEDIRIISLGGEITEMLYSLGLGKNIVAVDTTSLWPETVTQLPQIGYLRALSAEGVLSMSPTIVIANEQAGPHTVVEQIKYSGVDYHEIKKAKNFQQVANNLRVLGKLFSKDKQAQLLAGQIEADAEKFYQHIESMKQQGTQPGVLFLLSAGAGGPLVSGRATSADAMIRLVGAKNVVSSYASYKPISIESIIASQPDVLLMTTRTLKILGGKDKVLALPGIAATPAGKQKKIISMNGLYMLGFGPRSVDAANELASLLR